MTERRRQGYPLRVTCSGEGCQRTAYSAPKYRRIAVGWYFDRDGSVLCPDHLPPELADFLSGTRDADGWRLIND